MSVAKIVFTAQKKQTSCAYCGVGCGVNIELHNNVPVKLEGANSHPANKGKLCVKGTHLLDTISNEGRLLHPEILGKQAHWNQATEFVASKFQEIIEQHGKDAIALYLSGQLLTEDYYVANKFMKGYVGSANIDTNSRLCMSSAVAGYKRAFGEDVVPCNYEDLDHADVIFFIGSNAAWTHPVLFQRMQLAKENNPNLTFIALDPRATATTEMADIHLPLKPGSDAIFYTGLLHYLVAHNAIDKYYIEQATNGFEQTLEYAKSYDLATTSKLCGIDKTLLEQSYKQFAFSKNVVSFYSMGINQSNSGVDKCNAIINCHLATGKLGKKGNGPFSITGQPNAMGGREVGGLSNQLCAHLDIDDSDHQQILQNFWQSPAMVTEAGASATEIIEQIEQGKIKAIWIMATNPVVSLPDRNRVIAALKKCELVVVSDCVAKNDTLAFAHVKLPATTWLEKEGTVTNSERMISRQRGMIIPPGQTKHDWKILCEVAKKMGFNGFDFSHPHQIFAEFCELSGIANKSEAKIGQRLFDISTMKPIDKESYDAMKPTQWPINTHGNPQRPFADLKFSTSDYKARFIAITPIMPELVNEKEFPFVLNSGRVRDQWHTMTRTAKAMQLNHHINVPKLSVNPIDAKRKNIKNNDWLKVNSCVGEVIIEAELSDDVQPGQCFMPIHWNQQFASHANVSNVFKAIVDPISMQPQLKQVAVNFEKSYFNFSSKIHVRDNLLNHFKTTAFDVYRKTNHEHCHSFFTVENIDAQNNTQLVQSKFNDIKVMLGNDIQWLSLLSASNEIGRFIGEIDGRLVAIVECFNLDSSDEQLKKTIKEVSKQENNSQWLDHIFSVQTLSPLDKVAILKFEIPHEFLLGKKICSCFNIHQNTIEQAILGGNDSLELLGSSIKCGSGCGSCKPELTRLINACSINQKPVSKDIIKMETC
jgi:assimilatory nitrate reductase catalytic subunit